MQRVIPESELVLNPDGSIYHLNLRPDDVADTIILVGDPERVPTVSQHFDRIDTKIQKREFVTHTGELAGKRLSVVSTGISTDNIDIVLNELDALANIDLNTRTIKPKLKSLDIIRIGTAGGLQTDIPVDTFVLSTCAIGLEGLLHYYKREILPHENAVYDAFTAHCGVLPIEPYIVTAAPEWMKRFGSSITMGMVATCGGFYAPQGRLLRGAINVDDLIGKLSSFRMGDDRIVNFEMETAGIYGMGRTLGHRCCSVSAILANRVAHTFSRDPHLAVEKLIVKVMDVLTN